MVSFATLFTGRCLFKRSQNVLVASVSWVWFYSWSSAPLTAYICITVRLALARKLWTGCMFCIYSRIIATDVHVQNFYMTGQLSFRSQASATDSQCRFRLQYSTRSDRWAESHWYTSETPVYWQVSSCYRLAAICDAKTYLSNTF